MQKYYYICMAIIWSKLYSRSNHLPLAVVLAKQALAMPMFSRSEHTKYVLA